MNINKRPRKTRVQQISENVDKREEKDEFDSPITQEEKEEAKASEAAFRRLEADFQYLLGNKHDGYSFAMDIKTGIKEIQSAENLAKYWNDEKVLLANSLYKIEYAEQTDDFSAFKNTKVDRGSTEYWKYRLKSAIEFGSAKVKKAWGDVNVIKNKMFLYYFLFNESESLAQLHGIHTSLKNALSVAHFYFKGDRKGKQIMETLNEIKRCADALERIADCVEQVSIHRMEDFMGLARHDEMDETLGHFMSRTSAKYEKIRQDREKGEL